MIGVAPQPYTDAIQQRITRSHDIDRAVLDVVASALEFEATWRACYPECSCIRCTLALRTRALMAVMLDRGPR